jgi:hypothetical protein
MRASIVAAAAAVVIVVGVVAINFAHNKDVAFSLTMTDGACKPSEPEKIQAGYKHKVTWSITNINCPPQYVSLRNFKHPIGNGQYDPPEQVVTPDPVPGGPIATGQTVTIDAKVDKFDLLPKLFKYEIWLGDAPGNLRLGRDPDIDVWPF